MKFAATTEALAHARGRSRPIQAVANWTLNKRRYRSPTPQELVGIARVRPAPEAIRIVCDEGLMFLNDGETIAVYTERQLGILPHPRT